MLYVWFLSSFRGGCGYFLSFHRASCSLSNEARKNVVAAPKFRHDDKGKTAGICSEKRKEIRWRVQLQSLIFLIRCGKNPVIYDDPAPLQLSISFFNSIPHFNNFWFSPWSKKIPSNQPRELGLYPSRGRIFCPHVRYSNGNILSFWYRNQVIQKPKFIYASRTKTLMKKSKWDKIFLQNRNWQ